MSQLWKQKVVSDAFDNDIIPFWEGLKRREFLLHRCSRCGAHYWPMTLCPKHDDMVFEDMAWAATSGRGTVFAWEVVHKVNDKDYAPELPYFLVLVELEEGPIFPTRLVETPRAALRVGLPVEVLFDDVPETGMTLPLFKQRA